MKRTDMIRRTANTDNQRRSLYMFAVTPPADVALEIDRLRLAFHKRFGFVSAQRPPVHMAISDPFWITESDAFSLNRAISSLSRWATRQEAFPVQLHNFSFCTHSDQPAVFIEVAKNMRLGRMQTGMLREIGKYVPVDGITKTFKPHVPVGYDILPGALPRIKAAFAQQTFHATFMCGSISLWKHDRATWQVAREFSLPARREQVSMF